MNIKFHQIFRFGLFLLGSALILVSTECTSIEDSPTQEPIQTATQESDDYQLERYEMAERAATYFNLKNVDVIRAVQTVPRHLFVPEDVRSLAYNDSPLPIGYGQTISAPYIVAWMTEELELEPGDRVLEIGTGSGYQAAVLAELGYVEVYSIEIVPELAERAEKVLHEVGYQDLYLKQGDGYYGWEEFAPFDAIIVTAAPDHLPSPLVNQLAQGGRMLIPIGPVGSYQTMWKFRNQEGQIKAYNLGGVVFVPLVSEGEAQPLQIPTPED